MKLQPWVFWGVEFWGLGFRVEVEVIPKCTLQFGSIWMMHV